MLAELSIAITGDNGSTTVHLTGELDMGTAPQLRAALEDVHGSVTFDLRRLSFIDAAGLRVFAETASTNGTTTLNHPTRLVRRVLQICQMDSWLVEDQLRDGT